MKYLTTAEIREKFLEFFEEKGCKRMPSSSLIPDDPSLLLTSAGMVQFKPYFLQQKKLDPEFIGTTTVQKCVRTNDIDIIGTTGRHLSFFEMLGNFSFGEYFKEEMCKWALEFSVDVMGMPLERLYFTVYKDDDETIEIWKSLGVPEDHISRLGEEDNFWRAGPTGPCGPCSELHYDQGPEFGCGSPDCKPGCDCDRYLEFWNLVFTQYDGQPDGTLKPLPKKNIDTGMGLERMAALMQGVQSNYETDVLRSLIGVGEKLFDVKYGDDAKTDLSLRIIADHARAVTFMIADGILPGNEGREYVLRRLLRRAVAKAGLMGQTTPFLKNYVDEIVNLMGHVYPEVVENLDLITRIIQSEEERFQKNVMGGVDIIDSFLDTLDKDQLVPGDKAFFVHDTYGFPIEITQEICAERGFKIDMDEFDRLMAQQQERARKANTDDSEAAWSTYGGPATEILKTHGPTKFVGFETLTAEAKVVAIVIDGKLVDKIETGQTGYIFVDSTPFYGEMGGQVGDTGVIEFEGHTTKVLNTTHPEKELYAHEVELEQGSLSVGDTVTCSVDPQRRARITRNHTATHILHWALREVLGSHVKQAGSLVEPGRLRFDFTHFEAISMEDLRKIETLANQKVMFGQSVHTYHTTLEEARKSGVTALFGEKYGDDVRVVEVGDFSAELCGGCHVKNVSEIGFIKITNETSVGANARRIEACTSMDAYNYCNEFIDVANTSCALLKCNLGQVENKITGLIADKKDQRKKIEELLSAESTEKFNKTLEKVYESKVGYKVVVHNIGEIGNTEIRNRWDFTVDHLGDYVVGVYGGTKNGKALLMAAGTDKAVKDGFNAGDIIKAIAPHVNGGGGGKPRMAQAGGSNIDGIQAALDAAREMLQ